MIDVKLKFNIKNRENCEKELKKKKTRYLCWRHPSSHPIRKSKFMPPLSHLSTHSTIKKKKKKNRKKSSKTNISYTNQ